MFLAVGNDRAFGRLCAELGAPELASDPRFATNRERLAHRAELTVKLAALLIDQDGEALCLRLLAAGVPAGPVRDVAQVWAEPTPATAPWPRRRRLPGLGPADQALAHARPDRPHAAALRRARPRGARELGFRDTRSTRCLAAGVLLEQRRR